MAAILFRLLQFGVLKRSPSARVRTVLLDAEIKGDTAVFSQAGKNDWSESTHGDDGGGTFMAGAVEEDHWDRSVDYPYNSAFTTRETGVHTGGSEFFYLADGHAKWLMGTGAVSSGGDPWANQTPGATAACQVARRGAVRMSYLAALRRLTRPGTSALGNGNSFQARV